MGGLMMKSLLASKSYLAASTIKSLCTHIMWFIPVGAHITPSRL